MTFEELSDFTEKRMKMSHVYQPLLIKALIDAGGLPLVAKSLIKGRSGLIRWKRH